MKKMRIERTDFQPLCMIFLLGTNGNTLIIHDAIVHGVVTMLFSIILAIRWLTEKSLLESIRKHNEDNKLLLDAVDRKLTLNTSILERNEEIFAENQRLVEEYHGITPQPESNQTPN